jgi:hypothetical protein
MPTAALDGAQAPLEVGQVFGVAEKAGLFVLQRALPPGAKPGHRGRGGALAATPRGLGDALGRWRVGGVQMLHQCIVEARGFCVLNGSDSAAARKLSPSF